MGAGALAAMTVTYPLLLSFIAIASGTAVGATSLISRCFGAGEKKSADIPAARIYFICIFIVGIQMVPGFFFQGIGRGIPATVLSSARHIFFLLPMILLLPHLFGVKGLWISFPVADIMTTLLGIFWLSIEFRRQGISFR